MKTEFKKWLSMILAAAMLLTMSGIISYAESTRTGTEETTTVISDEEKKAELLSKLQEWLDKQILPFGLTSDKIIDVLKKLKVSDLINFIGDGSSFDLSKIISSVTGLIGFSPASPSDSDADVVYTVIPPETTVATVLSWYGGYYARKPDRTIADQDSFVGTGMTMIGNETKHLIVMGDVDGDGRITAEDARLTLRCAVELETYEYNSPQFCAADFNDDYNVTATDARLVLRAAVGLSTDDFTPDTPVDPPIVTPDEPVTDPTVPDVLPGDPVDMSKKEVLDLYKTAVNRVRTDRVGFERKSWQNVENMNLLGNATADNAMKDLTGNYLVKEADAKTESNAKGTVDCTNHMPACTLSDLSKIKEAACTRVGNNYYVKIVLADEISPATKESSFLGQITDNFLSKDSIDQELANISVLKNVDYDLAYKDYTITAEITSNGRFVSILHHGSVQVQINTATLLSIFKVENKNVDMTIDCSFNQFDY